MGQISLNNRGIKLAMMLCGLLFIMYCMGSWFLNTDMAHVDVEYIDRRSFFPAELVARVDSLERRMQNFSIDINRIKEHVATKVPLVKPTQPKLSFWLPGATSIRLTNGDNIDNMTTTQNHTTTLITNSKCSHKLKLLILVSSNLNHIYQRHTIRTTWGNDPSLFNPRWKTVFLVGRTNNDTDMENMKKEAKYYGDIVVGNFYEDFFNLSFKVEMGFEWADLYCDFDYLLKGDDDVFVNIPRLFNFLEDPDIPRTELYAGNVQYQANVFRKGRYFVTKEEYKKKYYPRYCSGGGFVLSRDVVRRMIPHFNLVNPLKIDDAYVGELALKAGIDVTHDFQFKMFQSKKKCKYDAKAIIHHPILTRQCMEKMYKKALLFEI